MPTYEVRFIKDGTTQIETITTPAATSGQALIHARYGNTARVLYWRQVPPVEPPREERPGPSGQLPSRK